VAVRYRRLFNWHWTGQSGDISLDSMTHVQRHEIVLNHYTFFDY